MTTFATATVARIERVTPTLTALRVSFDGRGTANTHVRAGQYVKLAVPNVGEATFAIASRPGEGNYFDFLVKPGSPVADSLSALGVGDAIQVGPVSGPGFNLEAARGSDVVLVATGSGISAIRSAVGDVIRDRSGYGRVWLLFGARAAAELAYSEEFDDWQEAGIEVVPVVSRGEGLWSGRAGWVTSHLPAELDPQRTWVFLSGRKEMISGVTDTLVKRGIPREHVSLNF